MASRRPCPRSQPSQSSELALASPTRTSAMPRYKAFVAPDPVLEDRTVHEVCPDFVDGYCTSSCHFPSHEIFRITGTEDYYAARPVPKERNYLTADERIRSKEPYDSDGAGSHSPSGPRHDNDCEYIGDIQILPTTDEIISSRRPYMPLNFLDATNSTPFGSQQYLDRLFRYLREDSVEPIIDAVHHACQLAVTVPERSLDYCQETHAGTRYKFFSDVAVEDLSFDERRGPNLRLSYTCPPQLAGRRMHDSTIFHDGMLVGLISVHTDIKALDVTFFTVFLRESTEAMKTKSGNHSRASVRLVLADLSNTPKVRDTAYYAAGLYGESVRHYLVDMPNVLPVSFELHLKRLQSLAKEERLAFKDTLCPPDPETIPIPHAPKITGQVSMVYDLNCLKVDGGDRVDLTFEARDIEEQTADQVTTMIKQIQEHARFDDGQATALFEALNRDFSLIQGPPGCGKSFLGVKLAQVITASHSEQIKRPTIVVCQTNHAVDDFLQGIIHSGNDKVIRLGSRSAAAWIKPFTLREKSSRHKRSCLEDTLLGRAKDRLRSLHTQCLALAEAIANPTKVIKWASIKDHLAKNKPGIFSHFQSFEQVDVPSNTHRRSRQSSFGFAFMFWLEGGDLRDCQTLQEEIVGMLGGYDTDSGNLNQHVREQIEKTISEHLENMATSADLYWVWGLELNERRSLAEDWASASSPQRLCDAFAEVHRRWQVARDSQKQAFDVSDKMVIEGQKTDVIALTSTGFVRYWDVISSLEPHTIIFEEASELLEAHTTCCMVPSLRHCISIGDPKQLRPGAELMILSKENDPRYRHDESVFERLIEHVGFPYSRLITQRRAHPDLADLLRAGEYPFLRDHPSTFERPAVQGLVQRMAWVDHSWLEDSMDAADSPLSKSPSNTFEVEYISALVEYLVLKQGYKFGEITILTPYKGQLAAFMRRLATTCSISLTDDDRDTLIDASLLPDEDVAAGTAIDVSMSSMLRITTIDSYQGEQARVILFSPVRSNNDGTTGFLKNLNRINVAVSRAEDGLFVVGNSSLISRVDYWSKMISVFQAKKAFGRDLETCCPRHPGQRHKVKTPADFKNIPACQSLCNDVFPCGHTCGHPCHPLEMHTDGRMGCHSVCQKALQCGHLCSRPCNTECGGCDARIAVALDCGHTVQLTCGADLSQLRCRVPTSSKQLDCGHEKVVLCSEQHLSDVCSAPCGTILDCGHACLSKCNECKVNGEHAVCIAPCSRQLNCGHYCDSSCHGNEACPLCEQICNKSCKHKACAHKCNEACEPCTELEKIECSSHPNSKDKPMICSMAKFASCSAPCIKLLSCGIHLCQSQCGETCSPFCSQCADGIKASSTADTSDSGCDIKSSSDNATLQDFSGNNADQDTMGMEISATSNQGQKCHQGYACPATKFGEYFRRSHSTGFDISCDLLYGRMATFMVVHFDQMRIAERSVSNKLSAFLVQIKNGPLAARYNQEAILEKGSFVKEIQESILEFRNRVAIPVEDSIERAAASLSKESSSPVPVLPFRLRLELVVLRGRMAMFEFGHQVIDFLAQIVKPDKHTTKMHNGLLQQLITDAAMTVNQIDFFIGQCRTKKLPRLETEFRVIQIAMWLILRVYRAEKTSTLDPRSSLGVCFELIETWPDTAGALFTPYKIVRDSYSQFKTVEHLRNLYGRGDRDPVHWEGYQPGHIVHCRNEHPYSDDCFPRGCPECGTEKPQKIHVAPEPTLAPGKYRTTIDQEAANAFFRPSYLSEDGKRASVTVTNIKKKKCSGEE